VAILFLALLVGLFGRIALSPVGLAQSSEALETVSVFEEAAAEPLATPTLTQTQQSVYLPQRPQGVVRQAVPQTNIPDRVRLEVITYTVQSGDNVFLIAEKFDLAPATIVWSNMEALQGAPWLLSPGLTLQIPPVDGAYHTVMSDESLQSIALDYEVDVADIINIWNDVEVGQSLAEGTLLVIPGGIGEDFDWEPPPPPPSRPAVGVASTSWGYCGDTAVAGYGANGYFILPTGSYEVSGWVFHDSRNPGHIGLDYRCHLGDPIVASDAGVVIFAGWGGGYGNLVRVSHGNGYQTYYAHFDSFAVGCGEPVVQGQILGYCGTTGYSSGPHLHYEIRQNGVPQNPALYQP
jgi:murein DD-endopeptidase MepM/ murein hydrolase activator NlpD